MAITVEGKVAEYRIISMVHEDESSRTITSNVPTMIMLEFEETPDFYPPYRIRSAYPTSEDELHVFRTEGLEEVEHAVYSGEDITRQELKGLEGQRIEWRLTQPGDYVELQPGEVVSIISSHAASATRTQEQPFQA